MTPPKRCHAVAAAECGAIPPLPWQPESGLLADRVCGLQRDLGQVAVLGELHLHA